MVCSRAPPITNILAKTVDLTAKAITVEHVRKTSAGRLKYIASIAQWLEQSENFKRG